MQQTDSPHLLQPAGEEILRVREPRHRAGGSRGFVETTDPIHDLEAGGTPRQNDETYSTVRARRAYYDGQDVYTVIDCFGRKTQGRYDDRAIDAIEGKFVPLVVQCIKDILGSATWARTAVRPIWHPMIGNCE